MRDKIVNQLKSTIMPMDTIRKTLTFLDFNEEKLIKKLSGKLRYNKIDPLPENESFPQGLKKYLQSLQTF